VGSLLRADDRAGLLVCDMLRESGVENYVVCEYGLENCLSEISSLRPQALLIIDAVYAEDLEAGDVVFLDEEALRGEESYKPVSTHSIPLDMIISIVKSEYGVEKTYLLGIVAKRLDVSLDVSPEVLRASRSVAEVIARVYSECFSRV